MTRFGRRSTPARASENRLGTESLMAERGALGSRLHRAEDGSWVAYAQWPTKDAWEQSRKLGSLNPSAAAVMKEATEDALPPILMRPVCDHLVTG